MYLLQINFVHVGSGVTEFDSFRAGLLKGRQWPGAVLRCFRWNAKQCLGSAIAIPTGLQDGDWQRLMNKAFRFH
jgi:hypothetical protein